MSMTNDAEARLARAAAAQLAAQMPAGFVEAVETRLASSSEASVKYVDPATVIGLGSLLVATASLGWMIYSDLRKSAVSKPSKEVIARRTRIRLEDMGYVSSDASRRVVDVVVEEIIEIDRQQPTD